MNLAAWALIAWWVFSGLVAVFTIGKPRKPSTPDSAVVSLLLLGGLAWLTVLAAT